VLSFVIGGLATSYRATSAWPSDAGKTYITWVPKGTSGEGITQALQDDFRVYTGIRDARNRALALDEKTILRKGQERANQHSYTSKNPPPKRVAVGTQSYEFNYGQIFQNPDLTCEIPAIDATGGVKLGLDVERIYHWWMGFSAGSAAANRNAKAKVPGARAIPWERVSTSRNCCSVVYRALTIGGASYYRSKWCKSVYLTPTEVFSYAERLRDTIDKLNRNDAAIDRSMKELGAKLKGLTVPGPNVELPPVARWLAMSKVEAGLFTGKASRKEQIVEIDRALQEYHQIGPWPHSADYRDDAKEIRATKALHLCEIIGQASQHAALKPKSDRRHAVAALLTRGWQVLKHRVVGNSDLKDLGDYGLEDLEEIFDKYADHVANFTDLTSDDF
jgi:hypothetical protein